MTIIDPNSNRNGKKVSELEVPLMGGGEVNPLKYLLTDNKNIYNYRPSGEDGFSGIIIKEKCVMFKGVDLDTFEILSGFNKDKNFVYIGFNVVIGADPETFEPINVAAMYYKDKKNVYYKEKQIAGADPKTAYLVYEHYSVFLKDSKGVYYNGEQIAGADPETFIILNDQYRKDKNNVYYGGLNNVVQGADPETFEALNSYEGKDKNYFYFRTNRKVN